MCRGGGIGIRSTLKMSCPQGLVGSSPTRGTVGGRVAQRLEREAYTFVVPGSNPGTPTSCLPKSGLFACGHAQAEAIG